MGLRFLKQNVPEIEIPELPTVAEYRRTLARGWDVVGISFYLDETPRALEGDHDYSHFDGKHLVWRHPTLSKRQLECLLRWS